MPGLFLTLLEALGEGSFGKVFKALHHKSNKVVAVKIIPLDEDMGEVEHEIDMLKECECPSIVAYYGAFPHAGQQWIMMEYCEGGSLCDVMEACGRCLTESQISAVLASAVEGLLYLHSGHRIHRDVKAGNLLLTSEGQVKLADFGVAATVQDSLERRRTVIGTPFWMAPEVITCNRGAAGAGGPSAGYDARADIWSLGITIIELAEGQPPHSGVSPLTAIFLIPTLPPPTLAEPKRWSKGLTTLLAKCLTKEAEARPDSTALSRERYIAEGREVAAAGALRSLMTTAREPLRLWRDKAAAKQAARQQRRESKAGVAPGGGGGTLKAADGERGGTLKREANRAGAPSASGGAGEGRPEGAIVGTMGIQTEKGTSQRIDFSAISAVARAMVDDRPLSAPIKAGTVKASSSADSALQGGGSSRGAVRPSTSADQLREQLQAASGSDTMYVRGGPGGGDSGTMLVHGGRTPGGDSTMVVKGAEGGSDTMVIKAGSAAALLGGAQRGGGGTMGGGAGTVLVMADPAAGADERPAFMRHLVGPGPGAPPLLGGQRSSSDRSSLESDGSAAHAPSADHRRPPEHRVARSDRNYSGMGADTLSKELAQLSVDMERDIGKVYRKYERLERVIRAEREKKLTRQGGKPGPAGAVPVD